MTGFVLAAYCVAAAGIGGMLIWSYVGMRRAERAADSLRQTR